METISIKHSLKRNFCQEKLPKNTWFVCKGYFFEDEPAKTDGTDCRTDNLGVRENLVANSQENYFIGKRASDILTCDKLLHLI